MTYYFVVLTALAWSGKAALRRNTASRMTLRLGTNPISGPYRIPRNYNWTGAPASFTSTHSLEATCPEPRVVRETGKPDIFYKVHALSLWVSRESVKVAHRCSSTAGCAIFPVLSSGPRVSINVDEINAFDPLVMFLDKDDAYHKDDCEDGELVLQDYWAPGVKAWIFRVHLDASVTEYRYVDDDIRVTGKNRVRLPIRLQNGRCDIYYGSAFETPRGLDQGATPHLNHLYRN